MEYKEYKMANRAVFLYRLRIAAVAVIAAFACGVIMAFSFLVSAAVAALSFPALIIIFFVYPSMLFKRYSIKINSKSLCITKGAVFYRKYFAEISDINYASTVTTPFQKIFGIFSLYLYTKSGRLVVANISKIPPQLEVFIYE